MGVSPATTRSPTPNAPQAHVTTDATTDFGTDGIFVDADNTTIQGLDLGPNAAGDNKTIEVVANNFTLQDSKTGIPGGGGSVYIDDWSSTAGSSGVPRPEQRSSRTARASTSAVAPARPVR